MLRQDFLLFNQRPFLFELHDQPWFPTLIRDELTLYLSLMWSMELPPALAKLVGYTPAYKSISRILVETLSKLRNQELSANKQLKNMTVVDVCSGAGGPIPAIAKWVNQQQSHDIRFIMTDLYPHKSAMEDCSGLNRVTYVNESIDARNLPSSLKHHLRTSFGSFHHLPESVARDIFADVVQKGHGIMIVEGSGRNIFTVMTFLVFMPFVMCVLCFTKIVVHSFTSKKLLNNVSLPVHFLLFLFVMPWLIWLDGTLSCLRTFEPMDYRRILNQVDGAMDKYTWEFKRVPILRLHETFLGKYFLSESLVCSILPLSIFIGIPSLKTDDAPLR